MKKLILAIIATAAISSTATAIAIGNGTATAKLLSAYADYYLATEDWIDELEEDYGDLMTGSDRNAEYLDKKYELDTQLGKH